jgi:hypothetical protein
MTIQRKIHLKSLSVCFVLDVMCFYLFNVVYLTIVLSIYKEIVAGLKSKPSTLNFYNHVTQSRILSFNFLISYKNFFIWFILILMFVFIKIFKNKYGKEALFALILSLLAVLMLNYFLPMLPNANFAAASLGGSVSK